MSGQLEKMSKTRLVEFAKKLNIPRRNVMEEDALRRTINETISRYKELLFPFIRCKTCLEEMYKQEKIDEKTYSQKLLEQTIRDLSCQYCLHNETTIDGETLICTSCGTVLQESEANEEGDYLSHKIKQKKR